MQVDSQNDKEQTHRRYLLNFIEVPVLIILHPLSFCSGCRGAIVVAEARSADEPVLTRRCVIMKVPDFTTEKYLQAQRQNAAAVLILLPKNISSVPQESIQVTSRTEARRTRRSQTVPAVADDEMPNIISSYFSVLHGERA